MTDPDTQYIYRAESVLDGEWTPITPPSYHRPEREMLEHRAEDEERETLSEYRIVRALVPRVWEVEPPRQPCVVEGCKRTVDEGGYCIVHEITWGRGESS